MRGSWMAAAVVAATAALAPAGARAADPLLAEARAAHRGGDPEKAGALLGEAVAKAQKAGNLLAEQEAAEVFRELIGRRRPGVPGDVEPALMERLDARRCGAFFSAPLLAGEILLDAVVSGESDGLGKAAAVLKPHVKGGKSGKAVGVLSRLAAAVVEARGAAPEKAVEFLDAVIKDAAAEDWVDVATAAGVELAALHVRSGREDEAAAAVAGFTALLGPKTEQRFLQYARTAVEKRLSGAPEKVLAPWKSAMEGPYGVGSAFGGGGAGGAGGAPGGGGAGGGAEPELSPLGKALKGTAAGRPVATVERTATGFEFRVSWDPKFRGLQKRTDGTRYLDEGGLTLGFADWAVGVAMADPEGLMGQPGESSRMKAGHAWYRLARGETWSLSKDGVVVISGGR